METLQEKCGGSPGYSPDWLHRYPAVPKAHTEGLEYGFYVDPSPFDVEAIALVAGDLLFNLRAALDHVVYELHVRSHRGPLPMGIRHIPSFPIAHDVPASGGRRSPDPAEWPEIKSLAIKQRRAIAFLQPYNTRNDKYREVRRALGELDLLNNIDKHRHLHLVETMAVAARVGPWASNPGRPALYGFEQESFLNRPLVGETEVFRWTFASPPPDLANELQEEREISAAVCIREDEKISLLVPYFRVLLDSVGEVLKRFEVFLPY